ncbi:MAG: hypothetical protein QG608_1721, partial [Actinomycetota bacterium]|nr:hypothetical protein [Actinomycetota bacterium]
GQDISPEIDARVEYIAGQLNPQAIMVWFKRYLGLPRFIAIVFDLIDLIDMFDEKDWIIDNVRPIDAPEQLRPVWRKKTELAGLSLMSGSLSGAMNHRQFPRAGWLADEIHQLLLLACDGPRGSRRRRHGFRDDLTKSLALLRENAALAGITFSPDLPDD